MSGSVLIAYFVLRVSVGSLCLWAGLSKLPHVTEFSAAIRRYNILPSKLLPATAASIVVMEILCGVLLVAGLRVPLAAATSALLFASFSLAIGLSLLRNNRVPCNCFGATSGEPVSFVGLTRALVLLAMSLLIGVIDQLEHPSGWPPIATLLPSLTVAASLVCVLRLTEFVPTVMGYLIASPTLMPSRSHRISFRHHPLDGSIRLVATESRHEEVQIVDGTLGNSALAEGD